MRVNYLNLLLQSSAVIVFYKLVQTLVNFLCGISIMLLYLTLNMTVVTLEKKVYIHILYMCVYLQCIDRFFSVLLKRDRSW